jgi:hypothetical protein
METARYGEVRSRIVPFVMNPMQRDLDGPGRLGRANRLTKMRQGGATTYFLLGRLFTPVITAGGVNGMLISQNSLYASLHFEMLRRAYRMIGVLDPRDQDANTLSLSLKRNLLHTAYSNRRELVFDYLDSRLFIESAEVAEAGQGVTLHHVVCSEVARWSGKPEDTVSNIKGALVPDGTFDEESTGNGFGGYFCERFLAAMDNPALADAKSHYYSWWWEPGYEDTLTEKEKDELEKDLSAEELKIIAQIHRELSSVAYVGNKKAA